MTNREAWNVNRYEINGNGIVAEEFLQPTDTEVRLYNDNDLVKVFDDMNDAVEWLDSEE